MFVFRKPLFTVIMPPKRKISDAVSTCKHKSSRGVLSISEKVKILAVIEIEKNRMLRLTGCMGRTILPFVN